MNMQLNSFYYNKRFLNIDLEAILVNSLEGCKFLYIDKGMMYIGV